MAPNADYKGPEGVFIPDLHAEIACAEKLGAHPQHIVSIKGSIIRICERDPEMTHLDPNGARVLRGAIAIALRAGGYDLPENLTATTLYDELHDIMECRQTLAETPDIAAVNSLIMDAVETVRDVHTALRVRDAQTIRTKLITLLTGDEARS